MTGPNVPTFEERPLVYVAAPYTAPNPIENSHHAVVTCDTLANDGYVTPVSPHLTLMWDLIKPHPEHWWLEYDLALLARCDALLRLPGYSPGADAEVDYAWNNDIPVFLNVLDLYAWVGALDGEEELDA